MGDLDRRLARLERLTVAADDPVVIIVKHAGDESEPSDDLCEEAKNRARRAGLTYIVLERGDAGRGDWEIQHSSTGKV